MPLAKPIRVGRRRQHVANAKDRVIKIKCDIFHSTAIICEFIYYAFNTILGLRNVYPPEDFKWETRYDIHLPLLVDTDLKGYLKQVTTQLKPWLENKRLSRVVLALVSKETHETVERWQFNINNSSEDDQHQTHHLNNDSNDIKSHEQQPKEPVARSDHDMQAEALQIFRQIFSSVTFMPTAQPGQCLFTVLSYVDKSVEIPSGWRQSDPHIISATADQVPIHGLTTSVHKLTPTVTYCASASQATGEECSDEC